MQVAGQAFGLDAEQALVMRDAFFEGTQRLVVFQVADMVADEGIVLANQARSAIVI